MSISLNNDSVAQQGERHLDRVEVAGSNPVGITQQNACPSRIGRFFFFSSSEKTCVCRHFDGETLIHVDRDW